MTGTGTSADPFIVDNFADFRTAAATSGAYVAFDDAAATKIIDINDTTYASGMTSTITLACTNIAGNGWEIRNLYVNTAIDVFNATSAVTVDNLSFINFVATIPGYAFLRNSKSTALTWKNSRFSGVLNGGSGSKPPFAYATYAPKIALKYCAVNVQYIGTGALSYVAKCTGMNTCNVEIEAAIPSSSSAQKLYDNCPLANTITRGSLTLANTSGSMYLMSGGSATTSYFAMDISLADGVTAAALSADYGATFTSSCFFDADLIADGITVTSASSYMHSLTTAQCKDADYLTGIGFPCVEVA